MFMFVSPPQIKARIAAVLCTSFVTVMATAQLARPVSAFKNRSISRSLGSEPNGTHSMHDIIVLDTSPDLCYNMSMPFSTLGCSSRVFTAVVLICLATLHARLRNVAPSLCYPSLLDSVGTQG